MDVTVNLSPELARRLQSAAEKRGRPADAYVVQLLEQHLPRECRAAGLSALIQSWIDDGDAEEQRETFEFLVRALDEDREGGNKLFPPEMKGITW